MEIRQKVLTRWQCYFSYDFSVSVIVSEFLIFFQLSYSYFFSFYCSYYFFQFSVFFFS